MNHHFRLSPSRKARGRNGPRRDVLLTQVSGLHRDIVAKATDFQASYRPPQKITVLVDTGSPNLWVNAECDTSGQEDWCEGFAQFDYTTSSTIEDTGIQDELSYGKGDVIIEYVTDVVTIGCKFHLLSIENTH